MKFGDFRRNFAQLRATPLNPLRNVDALVFGEFLEAYCAAAADLLGAESCERGMLLGLDLLCDLSMKL